MYMILLVLLLPLVESSSLCFDGHSPHEVDCTKFYICGHGDERILMQCPSGLHFDTRINACNHASAVECNNAPRYYENGCPTDHTVHLLLPHQSDCSKFYYCNFGEKVERNCSPGTHFDPRIQTCNWPFEVDCQSSIIPTSSLATDATSANASDEEVTTRETESVDDDDLPDEGCLVDQQLLPHEYNCTLFYYCDHGNKILRECPDGLYFNPIVQTCNWPFEVDCQSSIIPTSSLATDATSANASDEEVTTRETESVDDDDLPDEGCLVDQQLLPHEYNCTLFYYCDHGNKILRECPDGLYFNPIVQVCDFPSQVNCTTSTTPNDIPTTTESPTESSAAQPTTRIPTTAETSTTEAIDVETTTVELTTVESITSDETTPESTTADSTTEELTTEESITADPTTESNVDTTTLVTTEIYPDTTESEVIIPDSSPVTDTVVTERETETSIGLTTESLQTTTVSICAPGVSGYVPHPELCDAYYVCTDGVPILMFCLDGHEFDPELQVCIEIAPGGCTYMQFSTTYTATESTTVPTVTVPVTTTEPATTANPTTEEPVATESTIAELTTAELTTAEPTTEEPIATESTTVEQTTGEWTTAEPTTEAPIATESTTVEQTTEEWTTAEPTTEEPIATESINVEQTTAEWTTAEPTTEEPIATESTTVEQTTAELTTADPTTEEPIATESTTVEQTTGEWTTAEPTTEEPIATESTTVEQTTAELTTAEPTTEEPIATESTTVEQTTGEWTTAEPTTEEPIATESTTVEQTTAEWTTAEPTTEEPISTESTTVEQTTVELTTAEPTTEESIATESTTAEQTTAEWTTAEPTTEEPIATESTTVEQTTAEWTTAEPMTEEPIATESTTTELTTAESIITTAEPTTTHEDSTTAQSSTVELTTAELITESTIADTTIIHPTTAEQTTELITAESTTEEPLTDGPITTEPIVEITTAEETTLEPITPTETTWLPITTESVQTTTPSICAPGSFGNVPHPEQCDAYYMCVGGVPVPLFCLDGQEFDPELSRCVEIAPGGCMYMRSTTTDSDTEETIVTDRPTTVEEATVTTNADTTPAQSTTAELTTELITAEPTTEGISTEGPITTEPIIELTTTEETTLELTTPTESTWLPITTEAVQITTPSICEPGSFGNVPHPYLCDAYYMCAGGVPVPLFCFEGQEFDPELSRCVEIAPGGCTYMRSTTTDGTTGSTAFPTITDSDTEEPTVTDRPTTIEETSETTNADTTPAQSTTAELTTELITTEPTTEEISTEGPITTEPIIELTTTEEATLEPTTPTESTWLPITTEAVQTTTPSICAPGSFGNVPHPYLCDAYYMCAGGVPVPLFCFDGQEFDPELLRCVEIAPGGCTYMRSTTTDGTTGSTAFPTITDSDTEEPTVTDRPTTIREATETTNADTTPAQSTTSELTTELITAEPTTEEISTEGPITTEPIIELTTTEETTLEPTTPTESTWLPITTEAVQTTTPSICAPGSFGNVPHPYRCDAYYMCAGGVPVPLFCLDGHEFDPELSRCVEIRPGGCTYMRSTTTDGATGSTAFPTITDSDADEPTVTDWPTTIEEASETTNADTTPAQSTTAELTTELVTAEPTTEEITTEGPITTEPIIELTTSEETTLEPVTPTESTWLPITTESVQTTTPSICAPGSFGNVPHPYRCDAYYMCAGGVPVPLFCLDGQEFDPELSRCVEIAPGGCTYMRPTTTDSITGSTAYPTITDSDAEEPTVTDWPTTVEEVTETTNENITPDQSTTAEPTGSTAFPTITDSDTEEPTVTDWPTTIEVATETTNAYTTPAQSTTTELTTEIVTAEPTTEEIPTEEPIIELTTTEKTTVEPITPTETTWLPITTESVQTTTPSICAPGSFGNVPHPYRCDAYYMCAGGVPVPLFCLEGQEFDPELSRCIEIAPGGCTYMRSTTTDGVTGSTSFPTITDSDTDEPTVTDWPTTIEEATEATNADTTPAQSTTAELTTELVTAEPTTEEITTEGPITTEPIIELTTSEETTLGPITPTESTWLPITTESVQTTTPSICAPGSFGNVPHPYRCDAYYMCAGGVPVPLFCLEGQEFDPELSRCVEIAPGGCTYIRSTTTDGAPGSTVYPTITDSDTEEPIVTDWPTTVEEVTETTNENITPDQSTTAESTDSTAFPTITDSDTEEPTVTDWPTTIEEATETTNADTTPAQSTTTGLTTEIVTAEPTTEEILTEEPNIELTTAEETTLEPITPTESTWLPITTEPVQTTTPSICAPGSFGNVPHPYRCDAYYMCAGGVPVPLFCLDGQEFDPELSRCVDIAPGGCTYMRSTTTDGATESTAFTTITDSDTEEPTVTDWPTTVEPVETTNADTTPTQSTTAELTTKEITAEPTTDDPSTEGPTATEPIAELTTVEESTLEPITPTETTNAETTTQSTTVELTTVLITAEPTTDEHSTEGPTTTELIVEQTTVEESTLKPITPTETTNADTTPTQSTTVELTTELITAEPTTDEPSTEGSTTTEPIAERTTVEESTLEPITPTETTWLPITTESVQTTTPSICAPGSFGNIPHPDRCDAYYMCAGGVPVPLFCLDGQEFDPASSRCVEIAPGGCTYMRSTTTDSVTDLTEFPTVTDSDTEVPTVTDRPTTTEEAIAESTIAETTNADTTTTQSTTVELTTELITAEPATDEHSIEEPNTTDPVVELTTVEESTLEPITPTETTRFPITTESVQTTTPSICAPGSSGNMPHPDRCDAYYMCAGGVPVPLFCLDGQEFHPELLRCVEIAPGGCTYMRSTTTDGVTTELITAEPTTEEPSTEVPITIDPIVDITTEPVPTTTPSICAPGSSGNVPHPDRCDAYYMCAGGVPVPLFCLDGQEFDPELLRCVEIAPGGCTYMRSTTTDGVTTELITAEPMTEEPSTEVPITTDPIVELTTEPVQTTTPSICAPGSSGNVPHPDRCDAYYMCAGGVPVPLFCLDGQEFDPELLRCVEIAPGGCTYMRSTTTDGVTTELITAEPTTEEPSTEVPVTTDPIVELTTEPVQTTTPSICAPGSSGNVPHPDRCDAYFMCAGGVPVPLFCLDGQEFDTELSRCVEITPGGCTNKRSTTTTELTTAEPTTEERLTEVPITTEPIIELTTEPVQATTPSICAPGSSGNIPHPDRCDAYYMCAGGVPVPLFCLDGQEFDPELSACVPIAPGGCTYREFSTPASSTIESSTLTSAQPIETTTQPICEPGGFGNVPHPDRCDAYYMCAGGVPVPLFCLDGQEFDSELGACVPITEGGCTLGGNNIRGNTRINRTVNAICNPGDVMQYLPHNDKCNVYYLCNDGIITALHCQNGYEFNPESKQCVLIDQEGCTLNGKQ